MQFYCAIHPPFTLSLRSGGLSARFGKMTSTTIEQYTATSFGAIESENRQGTENIQFSYYTNKGLYVEPVTTIYGEEEVILPIGEKYVVAEKFRDGKGTMNIVFIDNDG